MRATLPFLPLFAAGNDGRRVEWPKWPKWPKSDIALPFLPFFAVRAVGDEWPKWPKFAMCGKRVNGRNGRNVRSLCRSCRFSGLPPMARCRCLRDVATVDYRVTVSPAPRSSISRAAGGGEPCATVISCQSPSCPVTSLAGDTRSAWMVGRWGADVHGRCAMMGMNTLSYSIRVGSCPSRSRPRRAGAPGPLGRNPYHG